MDFLVHCFFFFFIKDCKGSNSIFFLFFFKLALLGEYDLTITIYTGYCLNIWNSDKTINIYYLSCFSFATKVII